MSPRATETKNGASVLGISNQYDLVISLELVPFPQTSEVDCGQPQSLHQYTSTVCTQSAQNILNRQLFMLPAHKLLSSASIGAESPDFRHRHQTEYSAQSSMSTPAPLDPAQFSLR